MVTDDSETFRLYNLEAEVVGGACGAPDRGGISKNVRISNLYRVNLLDRVSAESRTRRGKVLQNTTVALLATVCRCRVKRSLESSITPSGRSGPRTQRCPGFELGPWVEGGTAFGK